MSWALVGLFPVRWAQLRKYRHKNNIFPKGRSEAYRDILSKRALCSSTWTTSEGICGRCFCQVTVEGYHSRNVGGWNAGRRYLSSLAQEREYREHGDGGESDVQFTKPLFVPPLSRWSQSVVSEEIHLINCEEKSIQNFSGSNWGDALLMFTANVKDWKY